MRKTSHSEMQFSLGSGVLKVFGRKLGYAWGGTGHCDCYRHLQQWFSEIIMPTLSMVSTAVTATQQRSSEVHNLQENQ